MWLCLLLSSRALAHTAYLLLRARELGRLTLVHFLERDFVIMYLIRTFSRFLWPTAGPHSRHTAHSPHPSGKSATHEHVQDVVHVDFRPHPAGAFTTVKRGHPVRVVQLAFVVIVQDLVGLLDGLEAYLRLRPLVLGGLVRVA